MSASVNSARTCRNGYCAISRGVVNVSPYWMAVTWWALGLSRETPSVFSRWALLSGVIRYGTGIQPSARRLPAPRPPDARGFTPREPDGPGRASQAQRAGDASQRSLSQAPHRQRDLDRLARRVRPVGLPEHDDAASRAKVRGRERLRQGSIQGLGQAVHVLEQQEIGDRDARGRSGGERVPHPRRPAGVPAERFEPDE